MSILRSDHKSRSVYLPFLLRGVESWTKFLKGVWLDLNFWRKVAEKEKGDIFQGEVQFLHTK